MERLRQEIAAKGYVTDEDVLALRRKVFPDGVVQSNEAEAIWELAGEAPDGDATWLEFFTEALTAYYVEQIHPPGYVDEVLAERIIARMCAGAHERDRLVHPLAFDLLVNIIAKSHSVPDKLTAFALRVIERTVLEGDGPTRHGPAVKGAITKGDVAYIRRVLYAAGGQGHHGISRGEAELLFELNDATIEQQNDPEWSDLFVKAIACYLMAHIGYRPPNREEALRRSAWLDRPTAGTGGFLAKMASGGLSGFRELFTKDDRADQARAKQRAAAAEAEQITKSEADWLADRIARDMQLHENEKVLIDYMKSLGASLPACLQERIRQLESS